MEKVELHHAFVWICDKCGRENTTLPLRVEIPGLTFDSGKNEAEILEYETLRELWAYENAEEDEYEDYEYDEECEDEEEDYELEVGHSEIYMCPRQVTCKYCKAQFEASLDG